MYVWGTKGRDSATERDFSLHHRIQCGVKASSPCAGFHSRRTKVAKGEAEYPSSTIVIFNLVCTELILTLIGTIRDNG
jgi:hypothetical protein